MRLDIRYFALEGSTSPVVKALEDIEDRFRAAILSDVERIAEYGLKAPVSLRSIKGHSPLMEIRNGIYRTFFVVDRNEMWVLHCCRKQDQRHGIEVASERMKLAQER